MIAHFLLAHLLGDEEIVKSNLRICCQIFVSIFTFMSFKGCVALALYFLLHTDS